eukprot:CAMPEP_0202958666 /NCGR_PEP_ID=MMETSP1396-20130829/2946_1 /ASSEMBLY_ACC=CAM_ASM_000872 /TAXON_ID= /ORGANISM="Pseudokeronopsis sp., Strain Brazil" /LENGTH=35 /DNA_ID= /DNA_START= /DNA_END= /DNA_ORIENTATION=
MDEAEVDDMIKELDTEGKGLIDIVEFAKVCMKIKD